jgi:hypothetical protein
MEFGNTQIASRQINPASIADFDGESDFVRQRLDLLLQANSEIAREKSILYSEREKLETLLMKNPLSAEKTFAYLGFLLGAFPPAALFTRLFIDAAIFQSEDFWILGIIAIVNLISAIAGYFSGRFIGKIVSELEKKSWSKMMATLPFIGIFWGIIAGGAGGVIVLGVGALFGAIVGGLVGGATLPVFSIFHRVLKHEDKIESSHFFPLAFGVAFIISAFFLGL